MSTDPQSPPNESLDQSDIDNLLAQGAAESAASAPALIRSNGVRAGGSENVKIQSYDFRNPVFLSEQEMRRLQAVHEDFTRYLSARLSLFLRMEFGLKLTKLSTPNYSKFTESLPGPTHLCLFKVEPLTGVCILDISPRLSLTIADRLLGGRGHSVKADRPLTEIEISLMDDVIHMIIEEWCAQWKSDQELTPTIVGHESSGHYLQTSPKDAVILTLSWEVNFGDCSEQIQIGVPYYTIEPLVRQMQVRRQKDIVTTAPTYNRAAWQESYASITMPVRAEWDTFEVSLREITDLRVGDVIEMPADQIRQTNLLLNGVPKFVGTVGLDTDHIAVQLTAKHPSTSEVKTTRSHGRKNS